MNKYIFVSTLAIFATIKLHAMDHLNIPQSPDVAGAPSKGFFTCFLENSSVIGAVAESSEFLAQEITKYFPQDSLKSLRILEVGAGSGVFTRALAVKLREGDSFDVVELTKDFIPELWEEFGENKSINIHCEDILKFESTKPYDLIVSGLPFNSFDSDTLFKILEKYRLMSTEGTIISFFEYSVLPMFRQVFVPSDEYSATRAVIESFVALYEFENSNVLRNIPPAVVHHLRIKK